MAAMRFTATLCVLLHIVVICNAGVTSSYVRKSEPSIDMPVGSFPPPTGNNAPEQVHITQGDHVGRGVIISWVTPLLKHPNVVTYWEAEGKHKRRAHSTITSYRYYNYSSGYIHHATIRNLKTLEHYVSNPKGQAVLFVGDLSYADNYPFHDNVKWDTWGRFVEKSTANQPWIWTAGNHELDFAPEIEEYEPFKPYLHRYHVPYKASQSTSPLWYSIKRASTYIIVLSSYSAYGKYTPQYEWLSQEFAKVNRSETPWLIVLLHSPWYDSNNYHYMEGESMRAMTLLLRVYITIGDGGNIEGLANSFTQPQPSYSAYREASFGHAISGDKKSDPRLLHLASEAWFHLSEEYPIKYEADRLPPPIVADLNGDGRKEILVATHDAKIQVLEPHARRVDEGFSEARVLAEVTLLPDKVRIVSGRRAVAMATGVIDRIYKHGQVQKQVLVVVTSGWSVMCFDHNLRKLWETNLQEDFPHNVHHREISISISNYTLKHGDTGLIIVGGRMEIQPHIYVDPFEEIGMAERNAEQHRRNATEKEASENSGTVDLRHFAFYAFAGRTGTLQWSRKNENIETHSSDASQLVPQHNYKLDVSCFKQSSSWRGMYYVVKQFEDYKLYVFWLSFELLINPCNLRCEHGLGSSSFMCFS
ncbi:FG-GAP repeat-containing protein [Actinidia rufa]|uniref:Purple acid phosphatase n=1 Tax=Actinidia rufa TaxID=165716 RepID=A0A7J0E3T4_9ERIC|nr:FG-GAP repeat-containing protein [Actinidia rufa]